MEIELAISKDPVQIETDAVIVDIFEDSIDFTDTTMAADIALSNAISALINDGEIKGKRDEITVIHTLGKLPARRIVVVGLGKQKDISAEIVRRAAGNAFRKLRGLGVKSVHTTLLAVGDLGIEESAQAIVEGGLLGLYKFTRHFSKDTQNTLKKMTFTITPPESSGKISDQGNNDYENLISKSLSRGQIIADATSIARDMVNEPSNFMTPTHLADAAVQIASDHNLEVTILDKPDMENMGMGGILGVAAGSAEPPKMIIISYQGDPNNPDNNLGLLGKGITFDTGGISIKGAAGMGAMKGDMAGAAAVISAIKAIAQLRPNINVTAIAAATENMPGGSAQKPGDVLQTMGGKTVEVENTDAEGRLVLADALGYARQMGLNKIIDVATLTGAIEVALGDICTGAFTNNQLLLASVREAGESTGEKIWELPMFDEYKQQNKSQVADVKNTGGRKAGSITAAQFLAEFSEDTPWVHLDIAGTSTCDRDQGYLVRGATGVPVRTLISLAQQLADKNSNA